MNVRTKVKPHNNAPELSVREDRPGIYRHKLNGRLYRLHEYQPRATGVLGYVYYCTDFLTGKVDKINSAKGFWSLQNFELTPYVR